MLLRNVTFYGFEKGPSAVTLDKAATEQQFQYDSELKVGIAEENLKGLAQFAKANYDVSGHILNL